MFKPGGTQYCVLLPGASVKEAQAVAEKLQAALADETRRRIGGAKLSLTVREIYRHEPVATHR